MIAENATQAIAAESDNVVELALFHDDLLNLYSAGATVLLTLYSRTGVAVDGASDIALTHVSGTTGADTLYRGELSADVVVVRGKEYMAKVVARLSGKKRTFFVRCLVP